MRNYYNTDLFKNRLGYYKVGNKKFHNAVPAMIEATSQNQPLIWDFNKAVFDNIDWSIPVEISLDTLYQMRLTQLRNEYDYLILYFSGGKDSLNILLTAIRNNIFIDEIVIYYPYPLQQTFNKDDISSDNLFSEVEFAAKPLIEKYKNQLDPRTVIRFTDLAESNIKLYERDDWFELSPLHITCNVKNRTTMICNDPNILELASVGKHVGLIFGIDKPRLSFSNNSYMASFIDIPFHSFTEPLVSDSNILLKEYVHYEPFYWTPFLPELVVKQCQVLANIAETNPILKKMLTVDKFLGMGTVTKKERYIANLIYNNCDDMWQTLKPLNAPNRKLDEWFWESASLKVRNNFEYTLDTVKHKIDSKFFQFNDFNSGKMPSTSGRYLIKTIGEK